MKTRFNQAACQEFEALLEDHLTGDLSGADAKKLAEHLESCAACSAALEQAAPSVQLLRTVQPSADPGRGFSRVVMARIRAEMSRRGEQKSIWQPFVSLAWRFAATATLALAVLVTFDAVRHIRYGLQPNLAYVPATETRDLFPDPAGPPANGDEVLMMVADTNHGKH
jgi:predicted anti-sigma-YlaC factor YlaD